MATVKKKKEEAVVETPKGPSLKEVSSAWFSGTAGAVWFGVFLGLAGFGLAGVLFH